LFFFIIIKNLVFELEVEESASAGLKECLNKAISRELRVSIQYIWQHVKANGFISVAVVDELKKIAITEMNMLRALRKD
jgi:hypothetical protein